MHDSIQKSSLIWKSTSPVRNQIISASVLRTSARNGYPDTVLIPATRQIPGYSTQRDKFKFHSMISYLMECIRTSNSFGCFIPPVHYVFCNLTISQTIRYFSRPHCREFAIQWLDNHNDCTGLWCSITCFWFWIMKIFQVTGHWLISTLQIKQAFRGRTKLWQQIIKEQRYKPYNGKWLYRTEVTIGWLKQHDPRLVCWSFDVPRVKWYQLCCQSIVRRTVSWHHQQKPSGNKKTAVSYRIWNICFPPKMTLCD